MDIHVNPSEWVRQTLSELGTGLYERDEVLAQVLLAVLSGQSAFLYGPPGTAKSLIARRISCVFRDSGYFEYLMQRFSTPEDVFGPVSITELKKDNYVRKTENYLPAADLAFLDEIWKSSPAILNTLLTIVNERKFKNGASLEDVPLKALIAASNEFPASNSGLDALYDRFILRLCVNPLETRSNFEKMISDNTLSGKVCISNPLSSGQWSDLMARFSSVQIGRDVFDIIDAIRCGISKYSEHESSVPLYVSDRRWQKSVFILKAAAYLSGRGEVAPVDTLILKSCLWSSLENKEVLDALIEDAAKVKSSTSLDKEVEWNRSFTNLDSEIREIFKPAVEKEPVVVNGLGCVETSAMLGPGGKPVRIYVPYGPKTVGGRYTCWDSVGSPHPVQTISVHGNEAVLKSLEDPNIVITVPMRMGELCRVPDSTVETYRRSLDNLDAELGEIIRSLRDDIESQRKTNYSPFVSESDSKGLLMMLEQHCVNLENRAKSLGALRKIVDDYVH